MEWNGMVNGLKEAVMMATNSYHWEIVQTLLQASVPKNCVEYKQLMEIKRSDELNENPNVVAKSCKRGYTKLVRVFLNSGLPPDYVDSLGNTMLHSAASNGHVSLVKILLNASADINSKTCSGDTPLFNAAVRGNLDVVKHLISAGADVNMYNCYGDTVLTGVLLLKPCNVEDILQLLLDSGCDPNIKREDVSPLYLAVLYDHNVKIVEMLLKAGSKIIDPTCFYIPLHLAARSCNIPIIQLLLKYGADINVTDTHGNNTLHVVVKAFTYTSLRHEMLETVKFLIEHGSLINTINSDQKSPLLESINLKAFDVAITLINSGADIDLHIHHELLHKAICAGAPVELIECLLEHGANVTTVGHLGTALHYVILNRWWMGINCRLRVAKLLLIYGANHYVVDYKGNTVLHWACGMGDVELVKYLILYGLNVDSKNRQGKKPIDIAHERRHVAIVNIIIEYHCNKYST